MYPPTYIGRQSHRAGRDTMSTTFDFQTIGGPVSVFFTATGQTAANTDQGVTFTLSTTAQSGSAYAYYGNTSSPAFNLYFSTSDGSFDTFRLTFQSTANPANTQISGTGATGVQLALDTSYGGTWRIAFTHPTKANFTTTVTTAGVITAPVGQYAGITFTPVAAGATAAFIQLDSLTVDVVNCLVAGTRVAVEDGVRAVETLRPGDRVRTADGRLEKVTWVGRSGVDPASAPRSALPVRIARGALGDGLPERDLLISADHAVGIGGRLVNAAALVNGATVRQERPREAFVYCHVATEAHELILAEGVPAETYLAHLAPQSFDAEDGRAAGAAQEMDLPRITSARLLPPELRARLAPCPA